MRQMISLSFMLWSAKLAVSWKQLLPMLRSETYIYLLVPIDPPALGMFWQHAIAMFFFGRGHLKLVCGNQTSSRVPSISFRSPGQWCSKQPRFTSWYIWGKSDMSTSPPFAPFSSEGSGHLILVKSIEITQMFCSASSLSSWLVQTQSPWFLSRRELFCMSS